MNFDVQVEVNGHTINVTGTISVYRPAKGPTMEHAGGEPAEGGEVDVASASMVYRRPRRLGYNYRPLCRSIMEGLQDRDIDDKVREALEDE